MLAQYLVTGATLVQRQLAQCWTTNACPSLTALGYFYNK